MDIDRELKFVELRKLIDELTYRITSKLILMYARADDDNIRSMIDSVFLICAQLLQNYQNPRAVIVLLKHLVTDCKRLGVEVNFELVKKIVDLSSELIT
ncbi:MAG: hypothetical protein QXT64_02025 [Desulfurococcaceae archaeon]